MITLVQMGGLAFVHATAQIGTVLWALALAQMIYTLIAHMVSLVLGQIVRRW